MLGAAGVLSVSAVAPALAKEATFRPLDTKVYELTFLKAKPGLRAAMVRFVVANWYPIDQRGVEQGLFTEYRLFEAVAENDAWDAMMMVGYPQELGFADPATAAAFATIRTEHQTVLIEGKRMRDLGAVVSSTRTRIARADSSPAQ
jgi:hypothetical protein